MTLQEICAKINANNIERYNDSMKKHQILSEIHFEWRCSLSGDAENLWNTMQEYEEEYFKDMAFDGQSIVSPFIKYECQTDNGEWVPTYEELPLSATSLHYGNYRCNIAAIGDGAKTNLMERVIILAPEYAQDKSVILHEMIHAFEALHQEGMSKIYSEMLLVSLYNYLLPKVPDLEERIIMHAHTIIAQQTTMMGGEHGILFFLKSLELDIRCGYKLGTVCGYGRDTDMDAEND